MKHTIKDAIKNRRSYYALSNRSPISDNEIIEIINTAVKHVPSAFNSQSSRVVLLLGKNHNKLWEITKNVLKQRISPEAFVNTEKKIDTCFNSGYGTILFFEDTSVIDSFQQQFAPYKDNFPIWSDQTAGMHQFAIWTMLEDAGLGASLQHYNPIIDKDVSAEWKINPNWKLIAQMPFGTPVSEPGEKEFKPLEDRVLIKR